MRVLISDSLSEAGIKALKEHEEIEVDVKTGLSEDELVEIIGDYHALIVRSSTQVTRRIIESAKSMKIIGRAGVGVDNIDVEAATENGIVVCNAPEGNTIAACEHTMAMMFALARSIPQANQALKNGNWEKKKFMGLELRNKTLLVLGLGKIGGEVAKRAKAMEMKVLGYDPYVSSERAQKLGVALAEFEEGLRQADFITVHLPLNDATYHLIGEREFGLVKKGVRILNVARGGVIDETALYNAVKDGTAAGAAVDVFEKEPETASPLFELENVIVTPHLGASTKEAQVNVAVEIAEEIVAGLKGEIVKSAVNIPSVKGELMDYFAPYLDLAERLGKFTSQTVSGRIQQLSIGYYGEIGGYDTTSLTNTFIKGLLRPILDTAVNYVNAPLVAKQRGIKVLESKSTEPHGYANLIQVNIKTEQEEKSIAASMMAKNNGRIVNIDGYSVDAPPEGDMLVIPHIDKPKVVGPAAMLIGENDVNIAAMQVGRKTIGGKAVMVLNVDGYVSPEIVKKIGEIDGILDVKYVHI